MTVETNDRIKAMYDHSEGKKELTMLIKQSKEKGKSGKNILEMTDLEKEIKLN